MGAIDPVAFLRSTPPFDQLPAPLFDEAAREMEIGFFTSGEWVARAGGAPLEHLWVIRRGSVRLARDGAPLQYLEEGELFGYTSLLTGQATIDVQVEEDLLAYRIPGDVFRRLASDAGFAAHFAAGLASRLRASLERTPAVSFAPDLSVPVGELVRRPAVWVPAHATVGEAAAVMRRERISSVLVRDDPPGIVTDRDLRNRVLAAGLGPATPVAHVLSRPLRSVEASAPVYEAWNRLLDAGTHHLAVLRDGAPAAVLTSTDLLRTGQGPMAVLRQVERTDTRDSLPSYPARLAGMASTLLRGGLDALAVAGFVARLDDALVGRILRWTEHDLGAPPAPYAWIAFGSEGRGEQTLVTHQDNALVYDDAGAGRADWYRRFAARVVADLVTAGFPESIGGHVATRLCDSLSGWVGRIGDAAGSHRVAEAGLHADFRRLGGALALEPLEEALSRAGREVRFLRRLAADALSFAPPPVVRLRLGGEGSRVDLKREGLFPVAFLARCYAIEVGSRSRGTLARLEAAREAGLLGDTPHATVPDAFRFLLGLRLRVQLGALLAGRPATSEVRLGDLASIERTRLGEAFRAVRAWQEGAAFHFQAPAP